MQSLGNITTKSDLVAFDESTRDDYFCYLYVDGAEWKVFRIQDAYLAYHTEKLTRTESGSIEGLMVSIKNATAKNTKNTL